MSSTTSTLPLAGVLVADLGDGPFATVGRLLADLGADVVRVEPAGGAPDRREGLLAGESSITFALRNANKESLAVDSVDDPALARLLGDADVVLASDRSPIALAAGLLDPHVLDRFPQVVVVTLTDFGLTGPRRGWAATPAVHFALSGVLARSGLPEIPEPLVPPEYLAYEAAAVQAFWVVLLALTERARTGRGDFLDFSVSEGLVHILDPAMGVAGSARAGAAMRDLPRGRPDVRYQYPIFPVRDGWVRICLLGVRQWRGMFRWLGEPAEFADPSFDSTRARFAAAPTLYPMIGAMLAESTRDEAARAGQELGVPVAAVVSPAEALGTAAFREAGSFGDLVLDDGSRIDAPSGWYEIDGRRVGVRRPAPAVGSWRPADAAPTSRLRESFRPTPAARPFEGLRVLDLGVIVVGAELGRLFGDYGADVIKIESSAFPDGGRQSAQQTEMSESVAWGHRNKRSLGLDLKSEDGKRVFRSLVEQSDVVLTNFKPGTLAGLGFGWDELVAINPRIVLSESSAFGNTGPWARRLGYGPLVRASAGMTSQWRYPEVEDSFSDAITVFPDHVVARLNAAAVSALLLRRDRTGRGGRVSTAQVDAIFGAMGDLLAHQALDAPASRPTGDAPRGVFPAAGDDNWVVVDGEGDERFRRLATAIGRADLLEDERFASADGRVRVAEELDAVLASWTRERSARDVMAGLQEAGVPAGEMLRIQELETDEHLLARHAFGVLHQPQIDQPLTTLVGEARAVHLPEPLLRPAPLLAEHSREVLSTVLGMSDREIDELLDSGALELHPSVTSRRISA
jgi:crotonobetainyl-CoA:carnitine CoA-transferase CaiB-like acyl-CoA transferase